MATTSSNGIATHVHLYTPNDERIASVVFLGNAKQGTNWTIRDTGGAILRRYHESSAGAWTWQQDYIYADGKLLASEGATPQQRRHYFADHLGTPRLITDGYGREVSRHNYYPFGEEIRASAAVDASTERLRFTGHERDYMTGATGPEDRLDYMHARYYENGWGRFLSVDPAMRTQPVRESGRWNRYAYVLNNPVSLLDPDGFAERYFVMMAFSHRKGVSPETPSGEYTTNWDDYFGHPLTGPNGYYTFDTQTARSSQFSKMVGDKQASSVFIGHSNLRGSLGFNDGMKALSSFISSNEVTIIASCNSLPFIESLSLAKGSSAIGFTSDRKDGEGNPGYIRSPHLAQLGSFGLGLLQAGFSGKDVAKKLQEFADTNQKNWGYRVRVGYVTSSR